MAINVERCLFFVTRLYWRIMRNTYSKNLGHIKNSAAVVVVAAAVNFRWIYFNVFIKSLYLKFNLFFFQHHAILNDH
jgi:hypothetical protein